MSDLLGSPLAILFHPLSNHYLPQSPSPALTHPPLSKIAVLQLLNPKRRRVMHIPSIRRAIRTLLHILNLDTSQILSLLLARQFITVVGGVRVVVFGCEAFGVVAWVARYDGRFSRFGLCLLYVCRRRRDKGGDILIAHTLALPTRSSSDSFPMLARGPPFRASVRFGRRAGFAGRGGWA